MNEKTVVEKEKLEGVEQIETELEALPDAGGTISSPQQKIEDILFLADNIDRLVQAQNKIRLGLLRLTQPGDWMKFSGQGKEVAEIGYAGANRIGSTLGVSYTNWDGKKETGMDTIGEWYRWEYECDASFRERTVRVYGRASSRDKFFGKEHGEWKLIHEVNEGNIKITARRSAMKEGVKVLFGLHHMDPKWLQTNGIVLVDVKGFEFKNRDEKSNEIQTAELSFVKMGTKSGGEGNKKWTKFEFYTADNDVYSTFDSKLSEEIKLIWTQGKSVKINYKTDQYGKQITEVLKRVLIL